MLSQAISSTFCCFIIFLLIGSRDKPYFYKCSEFFYLIVVIPLLAKVLRALYAKNP
uniref:Uncharacterized protein n=1 Tax=Utricularia reniformis TaxID=192314 RepID=A0A1Y0B4W1_9LAMI|nr:hypothetical protein AEK19_MT2234 [Utricularia reniformis]ART32379.1 hypothetical protein AEK19_MT2234 [Utricularia reniformis]